MLKHSTAQLSSYSFHGQTIQFMGMLLVTWNDLPSIQRAVTFYWACWPDLAASRPKAFRETAPRLPRTGLLIRPQQQNTVRFSK